MQQPDLFGGLPIDARAALAAPAPHTLARSSNPATSKAAAAAVPHFATEHHAVIFATLKEHAARLGGMTVHEIAAFCRLDAHAIGKRMNELEAGQVVEVAKNDDGSDKARKSPSGRGARVWKLKGALA